MPSPANLTLWNRKIHYYLGLYFLFFLWLFAFTGLLLNHPTWTFDDFWPNRKQSTLDRRIQTPPRGTDLDEAQDLMRQLGILGEIEWTATRSDPNIFDFRVTRPGHLFEVHTDFDKHQATVQRTSLNGWGVAHILHTFTGVRLGDTRNHRDWIVTTVWALAMDALAAGLIVMVLSGLYMWYGLLRKRLFGAIAFGLGMLICLWFVIGLKWLASS